MSFLRAVLRKGLVCCWQASCMVLALAAPVQADTERLRIEGSTTLLPAVQRLADEYRKEHSTVAIEVHGGGSAQGFSTLIEGGSDVAASSRYITAPELERAMRAGVYPVPFRVAHDAVIPIVHKTNRIRSLSLEQLGKIYRGEIDNWNQLGGADREIRAVAREAGSGTHAVWRELVSGTGEPIENLTVASTGPGVVRTVADHRGAIGYIGLGNLNANVRPLRVDGVIGSLRNVRSGAYPLGRDLFLFTRGWPQGQVLEFIDDALDPDGGQRIITEAGFIPLYDHPDH